MDGRHRGTGARRRIRNVCGGRRPAVDTDPVRHDELGSRARSAGEREAADLDRRPPRVGRLGTAAAGPRRRARAAPTSCSACPVCVADLPALLVHAHLDVVPAEADDWSVDPFGGVVSDGYVWGRGAVDMKDMCAMTLATLLRWGRDGVRPQRDVVVAFVADEEDQGAYGARWLADAHPELFDGVEAAIGESGGMFRRLERGDKSVRCYPIAAAERGSMHLRLTARGVAGHASRPGADQRGDPAGRRAAPAGSPPWPMHLSPAGARAARRDGRGARDWPSTSTPRPGSGLPRRASATLADVARFTVRARRRRPCSSAGYKVNVIPATATAEVDVRCPPGYRRPARGDAAGAHRRRGRVGAHLALAADVGPGGRPVVRGHPGCRMRRADPEVRSSSPTAWAAARTPRRSRRWGSPGTGSLRWARTRRVASRRECTASTSGFRWRRCCGVCGCWTTS